MAPLRAATTSTPTASSCASETDLRLGIEADFIPGREDRMANLLEAREWDYVVGSVHFLGEHAVDYDRYDVWTSGAVARQGLERRTSTWLGEAARSGLFDILAHPDLVKIWGPERPRPEGDLRRFYDRAMEGIAESGIAVEVSTAGLRKPVGRALPRPRVPGDGASTPATRSRCRATRTRPTSSASATSEALRAARRPRRHELCVFEGRERRLEPIGAS